MTMSVIFTVLGAILLGVFLKKRVKKATPVAAIIKAGVSVCFIGSAVSGVIFNKPEGDNLIYGMLIVSGLVFGLLGDIWLDLKYAHPDYMKTYNNAGFCAFMMVHTCFVAAMLKMYYIPGNIIAILIPIGFALLLSCLMPFSEDLLKVNYGEYKAIASIYTFFLISLPSFSFSLAMLYKFKNIPLDMMFAAGLLFCLSDAILNATYFGEGKNRPVDIITNHITYYMAQFIAALSICFIAG